MRPASPSPWSTGALLPTMSIQTYVHVHGPHSLVPVAGWSRWQSPPSLGRPIWRQPQQQHGVLLECRSKPSCCVAAGSRRVRYIIRCTFGQGHAVHVLLLLLACSPLSNFACCIPAAVFLPMFCAATYMYLLLLHTATATATAYTVVSLAASTRRLNRCPRAQAKSAFPNASGRINLEN